MLRRARVAQPDEDDLLTMLWEQDFGSLRYSYVDLAVDNVAPVDSVVSEERPTHVPPPAEEEEEEQPSRAGIVNIDEVREAGAQGLIEKDKNFETILTAVVNSILDRA